jgi:hypothetical protein
MRARCAGNQKRYPGPSPQGDEEPGCISPETWPAKDVEQSRNEENSSQNSDSGMEQDNADVGESGRGKNIKVESRDKQENDEERERTPGRARIVYRQSHIQGSLLHSLCDLNSVPTNHVAVDLYNRIAPVNTYQTADFLVFLF